MFIIYCLIIILAFLGVCIYFYIRFKKISKEYDRKMELLAKQIDKKQKKVCEIKSKSYYEFFSIVRHIFSSLKPFTLSVFVYRKNTKLKVTNIDFLYQIKSDGGDGTIIFTGEYGNVPISNIDVLSKLYDEQKDILLVNDINELNELDSGLVDFLSKKGIKRMCLVNIFNEYIKNTKPISFFVLTYKDDFITKDDQNFVLKQSKKISEHLISILSK